MTLSRLSTSGLYNVYTGSRYLQVSDITATSGSPTTGNYNDANGSWTFYRWASSGSITFATSGFLDMLVVGGGGGSGGYALTWGAGGGAGAMLELSLIYLPNGVYTVTVGAGGNWNTSGGKSSFGTWGAEGGCAGNLYGNGPHRVGGSGGGGSGNNVGSSAGSGGYSDMPYTRIGGNGNGSSGGAGGGAGGAGASAPGSNSGGGAGRSSSITGSAVTYARGGSAGQNGSPSNNVANSGNGGVGRNGDGGDFSASTGVVVIRVKQG